MIEGIICTDAKTNFVVTEAERSVSSDLSYQTELEGTNNHQSVLLANSERKSCHLWHCEFLWQ